MNTAVAIGALVVGALVLVGVVLMASAWRGDTRRGSGVLSRETVRRDRGEAPLAEAAAPTTGREVELAARSATLVQAPPAPPSIYVPPEPEQVSFSRRQFFNRSAVALMSLGLAGFGAAVVAFLWPKLSGGFGSKISVGNVDAVKEQIRANNGFLYLPEGRAWITEYPVASVPKAEAVYPPAVLNGMQAGLVALYQKCPHLGCRVPDCASSQWFECPCHGSQYNQAGEKKAGPAPRGMDLFATSVAGGNLVVDTGTIFQGAPIGTNTTGQEAEGPHCITGGGGH